MTGLEFGAPQHDAHVFAFRWQTWLLDHIRIFRDADWLVWA